MAQVPAGCQFLPSAEADSRDAGWPRGCGRVSDARGNLPCTGAGRERVPNRRHSHGFPPPALSASVA